VDPTFWPWWSAVADGLKAELGGWEEGEFWEKQVVHM
jgi:hypothetical protein